MAWRGMAWRGGQRCTCCWANSRRGFHRQGRSAAQELPSGATSRKVRVSRPVIGAWIGGSFLTAALIAVKCSQDEDPGQGRSTR